jgi:nitrogen regulatory protein PII
LNASFTKSRWCGRRAAKYRFGAGKSIGTRAASWPSQPAQRGRRRDEAMQKIEALIGSAMLEAITDALAAHGAGSATMTPVTGLAAKGRNLSYRGVVHQARDVLVKVELVVPDHEASSIADVVRKAGAVDPRTRIWVSGVAEPSTTAAVPRYDIAV